MCELLDEISLVENSLITTSNCIQDIESVIVGDVTSTSSMLLNIGIRNIVKEYSLDISLIDVEGISPIKKYEYDVEGLKVILEKLTVKLKDALIKFKLLAEKIFLKILNGVSGRESTIKKLIENLPSTPENPQLSLALSKKIIALSTEDYKPYPLEQPLDIEDVFKFFKGAYESNKNTAELLKDDKSFMDRFITSIAEDLKDNKNDLTIVARIDNFMYSVEFDNTGRPFKVKMPIKNSKRVNQPTGKDMETMLDRALKANQEFRIIIDGIFSIFKDVEDLRARTENLDSKDRANNLVRKHTMNYYNMMKTMLPWLAFQSGMHIYKHIGFTVAVAKEFSKVK